jgi:hypothetical protein
VATDDVKDTVRRLLQDNIRKSEELVLRAATVHEWAQYVTDLSQATLDVLPYAGPRDADWPALAGSLEYLGRQQDLVLGRVSVSPIQVAATASSAATFQVAMFAVPGEFPRLAPDDVKHRARPAAEHLAAVVDRYSGRDRVASLMEQFGLDVPTAGQSSPLAQFDTAWAAFERPVKGESPAVTSLIPMREAVNHMLASLLRRRPTQEPAKRPEDKLASIGRQLARDGVSLSEIQRLGSRTKSLLDELSGYKSRTASRPQWQTVLRRATLLTMELLQMLDPEKLKPL